MINDKVFVCCLHQYWNDAVCLPLLALHRSEVAAQAQGVMSLAPGPMHM